MYIQHLWNYLKKNLIYMCVTFFHIIPKLVNINDILLYLFFFFFKSHCVIYLFWLLLDMLFCIDSNGKPVTIPETMKNKTVFNDFHEPPKLGKWFALIILGRNSVLFYNYDLNGLTVCKIRQLKKLGYEPIVVSTSIIFVIDYLL